MKKVTKWESYEDAKQRIEAKKVNAATVPLSIKKQFKGRRLTKAQTQLLTDCGGIQPLPILPLPKEE